MFDGRARLCVLFACLATLICAAGPKSRTKSKPSERLAGKYFGYEGKTVHHWEFSADGTFVHTVIPEGGASAKHSESGEYFLSGDSLSLTVRSEAGVSDAEPAAGQGLVMSSGPGKKGKKASVLMTFRRADAGAGPDAGTDDGIVIDGVALKPKTW